MGAEPARASGSHAAIAGAFERAPALVPRLDAVVSVEMAPATIVERAREILRTLTEPERIAVLAAHPRIGADPRALSPLSRAEQGADADPQVLHDLSALNGAYERKFGFRFVIFVEGRSQTEILAILRERFGRTRQDELATGIEEFLAIARDRLEHAR